jgi:hypothetical protein
MNKTDVVYTPEAEKRLDIAKNEFVEKLEEAVKSRKYYPGDEVLEITASDIEIASKYVVFRKPNAMATKLNILIIYMIFGFLLTVTGLFYEEFINLVRSNPTRIIFVAAGFTTSLMSLFMYIKYKHEAQESAAKEYYIRTRQSEKDTPNK